MAKENKKILIGEDEQPLAKALTYKLKKAGFDVSVVFNGEEVIKFIEKNKTDLIILDLVMPKKDGFSVLTEMKEKNIKIPVIVASNLGQQKDIEEAKALGAVDYIIKSDTQLGEIVDRINKFLKL